MGPRFRMGGIGRHLTPGPPADNDGPRGPRSPGQAAAGPTGGASRLPRWVAVTNNARERLRMLKTYFDDLSADLAREIERIREFFATHKPSAGTNREDLVAKLLKSHVLPTVGVETVVLCSPVPGNFRTSRTSFSLTGNRTTLSTEPDQSHCG